MTCVGNCHGCVHFLEQLRAVDAACFGFAQAQAHIVNGICQACALVCYFAVGKWRAQVDCQVALCNAVGCASDCFRLPEVETVEADTCRDGKEQGCRGEERHGGVDGKYSSCYGDG